MKLNGFNIAILVEQIVLFHVVFQELGSDQNFMF